VSMIEITKDIERALKKYPTLKYLQGTGKPFIAGTFIAHSKESDIEIESYEIKMVFPTDYPHSFPKVCETGGKIMPQNATRHIYADGSLCLGNLVDVARACRNGITLTWFLDEILNVHLCREFVREETGKYPTGERSHDVEGIWESYYEILCTTDKSKIFNELELILLNYSPGRNSPCYCNSGKKYKICHSKIEPKILDIGREKLKEIYDYLKANTK
jgi:ubiquitin-protein ligase